MAIWGIIVCWVWIYVLYQADKVVFDAQVGDGTTIDRHTPVAVVGLPTSIVIMTAGNVRFGL